MLKSLTITCIQMWTHNTLKSLYLYTTIACILMWDLYNYTIYLNGTESNYHQATIIKCTYVSFFPPISFSSPTE